MKEIFSQIPITQIKESPVNPRLTFDPASMGELKDSIAQRGIITPLLLRPMDSKYEIVAGHRRFRAARDLGLKEVPAIVRELSDEDAAEITIIENLQRKDVEPLDEAEGYASLMKARKMDRATIAAKVGKSVSYVAQRLKLADLIEPAKKMLRAGELSVAHAIVIARVTDEQQEELLGNFKWDGIPIVKELLRRIDEEYMLDLSSASWRKEDAELVPAAGSCKDCQKRTGANQELFSDIQKKDLCSDKECFEGKQAAFLAAAKASLKGKGSFVEISEQRYNQPKGSLNSCQYILAKQGCGNPKPALWVDGKKCGRTTSICADPKCKICRQSYQREHDGTSSSSSKVKTPGDRYERRMEIWNNKVEAEYRERLMKVVIPHIQFPVTRWHLIALLRETMQGARFDGIAEAAELCGIKWSTRVTKVSDLQDITKKLEKRTDEEIFRLIFTLAMFRDRLTDPSFGHEASEMIEPLSAIHAGPVVNHGVIHSDVESDLESQKPKPPKEEKTDKKQSGKSRKPIHKTESEPA